MCSMTEVYGRAMELEDVEEMKKDENLEFILGKLKEEEVKHLQQIADGDKRDNHNGDSNLEREQ